MGVHNLWGILSPVKTHKDLKSLKGKVIAVDLSIWICESSQVLQGKVVKPHIRVTNLTQLGVHLIFVLDGEPPEIKWAEMARRIEERYGDGGKKAGSRWGRRRKRGAPDKIAPPGAAAAGGAKPKKMGRSRFKAWINECREMLEHLGVPCVQAVGEAEAMCALLNKEGVADACLTEDGDVFLYGARTVYKNFTLNTKDPHIECYEMDKIEARLGLDRQKLIALALLMGCDYTTGVPGVGKGQSLRVLNEIGGRGVDTLRRFRQWTDGGTNDRGGSVEGVPTRGPHCTRCSHEGAAKQHRVHGCATCRSDVTCRPKSAGGTPCGCAWHAASKNKKKTSVEETVKNKACRVPGFPNPSVIDEYLVVRDQCPTQKLIWRRPRLIASQGFIMCKLEWPEEYAVGKVLPLVTLWDLTAITSGHPFDPNVHMRPAGLVKRRTRQGVACVEVQWHRQVSTPGEESSKIVLTTIEKETLFAGAFPDMMKSFDEDKMKVSKTKSKGKKTARIPADCADSVDALTSAVGALKLSGHESDEGVDDSEPSSISSKSSEISAGYDRSTVWNISVSDASLSDLSVSSSCGDDAKGEPLPLSARLRLKESFDDDSGSSSNVCAVSGKENIADHFFPPSAEDDLSSWVIPDDLESSCSSSSISVSSSESSLTNNSASSPQTNLEVEIVSLSLDSSDSNFTEVESILPDCESCCNTRPANFSLMFDLTQMLVDEDESCAQLSPVDLDSSINDPVPWQENDQSFTTKEAGMLASQPLEADTPTFAVGKPSSSEDSSLGRLFRIENIICLQETNQPGTSIHASKATTSFACQPFRVDTTVTQTDRLQPSNSKDASFDRLAETPVPERDDLVHSRENNGIGSRQNPATTTTTACQPFDVDTPVHPSDVDTPVHPSDRLHQQSASKGSSFIDPLQTPVWRLKQNKPSRRPTSNNRTKHLASSGIHPIHEQPSPVSLQDRLRQKHAGLCDGGVLSVMTSLKNKEKEKKKTKKDILMEIFDDNDSDD